VSQPKLQLLSNASDISLVGGKAKSLGDLLRAGFTTQGGFVITTAAFKGMDNELEREILEAFDKLKVDYVAIRSSATSEDGKKDAWAGQLDTFLNINRGELIETIQKSWAAINSERAKSYAKAKNIKAGKMAVIVQPMLQSDIAGIAFSAHPVTQNKNQTVIEAGLGLGEAIVSGEVTPDTFIVDKKSGRILEKHISNQAKKLIQGKSGKSEWQDVLEGNKQKLSDEKTNELTQTVAELEKFYGFPVDVEWLIKDNTLFIMQSRPITTLAPGKDEKLTRLPDAPKGVKYALSVPQSVLFADLSLRGNLKQNFKKIELDYEPKYIAIDAGGAMSWNYDNDQDFINALLGSGPTKEGISKFTKLMELTAKKLQVIATRIESTTYKNYKEVNNDLKLYWDAYELHSTSLFTFWNVEYLLSNMLLYELEKAGWREDIKNGMARFFVPYKPNYFILERQELAKIAKEFAGNDTPGLEAALEKHIQKFGFLLAPFNLGAPPSVESLANRIKQSKSSPLKTRAKSSLDDLPRDLQELGILAQKFSYWKTNRLDIFSLADSKIHHLYKAAAQIIGISLEQLFAMTRKEILSSLKDKNASVDEKTRTERQKAYCLVLHMGKIGFYRPNQNKQEKHGLEHKSIQGVSACAGRVKAKVRVIKIDQDLKKFRKGEVLVTKMTRPEYGTVLDYASAFVTDEGGMLCHAAIISREMNKPCIIGTKNATKILKNGDTVEVDADQGVVNIL
jgi:phosphoenolpyruvate synthase/pyruvate phosphate dikinase